ncbi:MAG: Magnesium and cobalt efflux protein CorC [Candidatus Heimdallarchaeota archaeon LC_2]|nr:MAG: Magnesium and cobalt efflux protein CorC [Candidatus Heimdallarchaeota archaeon LC_2]
MSEISIYQFLFIIFLVLLNAFFVASEFAFVKVRPTQVNALIAAGSKRAVRVKSIIDDLDKSLSSTQLGITLASIALGIVGEEFFKALLLIIIETFGRLTTLDINTEHPIIDSSAFITGYLIITFLHVTIGELAPKSISIQFAEKTAIILAEPLHWFMVLTDPLLKFFVWSSNSILRLINIPVADETHHQVYTENELKAIIADSIEQGELESYESRLIFNILNFTDRSAKSILTPRIDVKALPIDTTPIEILELSNNYGFSRIPIYGETLDDIKGFVHIKDLIGYNLENDLSTFDINTILRSVIIIPENKPLDDLLKEMQLLKTQVAIVVNEYGSIDGIVTIEDILEYIVGPIEDEFDSDSRFEIEIIDDSIHSDGLITIEVFNSTLSQLYGIEIQPDSANTLAGYIIELCKGELPSVETTIRDDQLEFKITELSGNRIESVITRKIVK